MPIHTEDPYYLMPWLLSHVKLIGTQLIRRLKVKQKGPTQKKKGATVGYH